MGLSKFAMTKRHGIKKSGKPSDGDLIEPGTTPLPQTSKRPASRKSILRRVTAAAWRRPPRENFYRLCWLFDNITQTEVESNTLEPHPFASNVDIVVHQDPNPDIQSFARVLFDSGSTYNLVSPSLIARAGIPYVPYPRPRSFGSGVDGTKLNAIGEIEIHYGTWRGEDRIFRSKEGNDIHLEKTIFYTDTFLVLGSDNKLNWEMIIGKETINRENFLTPFPIHGGAFGNKRVAPAIDPKIEEGQREQKERQALREEMKRADAERKKATEPERRDSASHRT